MAEEKLKIAFLSLFSGLIPRGVETLICELAPRLSQRHEIVVFQGGRPKGERFRVEQISTNWKPTVLETPLTLSRRLFLDSTSLAVRDFTLRALKIIQEEKFDLIVCWNNGWQTLLAKTAGAGKVVVVGQSGPGWDDMVNLWLFPDRFIGLTNHQDAWAKRVNPFVKIAQIPNGVDLQRFTPRGERLKLNLEPPVILSVAALVPIKRLHLAIEAVAKLKQGSLVLVGKGELKEELEQLGGRLLGKRFKILELPYEDMSKVYRSADLFTFPTSPWESFGIVQIEAMASGLPVVAGDDPIRREIIGEAGLFVNPEDVEEYAVVLKKALSMDWGDKPRQQAEKFSWDVVAQKYDQLFREVAG